LKADISLKDKCDQTEKNWIWQLSKSRNRKQRKECELEGGENKIEGNNTRRNIKETNKIREEKQHCVLLQLCVCSR
jgi:hypothetical protein